MKRFLVTMLSLALIFGSIQTPVYAAGAEKVEEQVLQEDIIEEVKQEEEHHEKEDANDNEVSEKSDEDESPSLTPEVEEESSTNTTDEANKELEKESEVKTEEEVESEIESEEEPADVLLDNVSLFNAMPGQPGDEITGAQYTITFNFNGSNHTEDVMPEEYPLKDSIPTIATDLLYGENAIKNLNLDIENYEYSIDVITFIIEETEYSFEDFNGKWVENYGSEVVNKVVAEVKAEEKGKKSFDVMFSEASENTIHGVVEEIPTGKESVEKILLNAAKSDEVLSKQVEFLKFSEIKIGVDLNNLQNVEEFDFNRDWSESSIYIITAKVEITENNSYDYVTENVEYFGATFYDYEQSTSKDSKYFLFGQCSGAGYHNSWSSAEDYTVKQGLASEEIIAGNFKLAAERTMQDGSQPFSNNVVGTYGLPFIKDSKGYYTFDSSSNFTSVKDLDDNGNMKLYSEAVYSGTNPCFFPLNEIGDKTNEKARIKGNANYYFGMSFSTGFVMPVGGKVGNDEMVFEFSGDDDVWVYIDKKLVLDIGGIHNKVSGSINFATGEIFVGGVKQSNTISLEENKVHTLDMYYLERGAHISNCKIKFNLQEVQKPSFNFEEQHHYYETKDLTGTPAIEITHSGAYENTVTSKAKTNHNDDEYKLVKVEIDNKEVDIEDSYKFEGRDVKIVYYYVSTDLHLNTKHVYSYKDGENEVTNTVLGISNEFKDSLEFSEELVNSYDGKNYRLVEVEVNGTKLDAADVDKIRKAGVYTSKITEDTNIVYYYELILEQHKGTVTHIYKDLSKNKVVAQFNSEKFFVEKDSFIENAVKTDGVNDDYKLVKVTVDGVDLPEIKDCYEFEFEKDYDVIFYYERGTKPTSNNNNDKHDDDSDSSKPATPVKTSTPVITPVIPVVPVTPVVTPSIPETLPQTGGAESSMMMPILIGMFLMLIGGKTVLVELRKKKEENLTTEE